MKITYPSKPWADGQRSFLIDGLEFMYSMSLKKWVPITPGYESSKQLVEAFDVETVSELNKKFEAINAHLNQLDSDFNLVGRIFKQATPPTNAKYNDVWIQEFTGRVFHYSIIALIWVEINHKGH